MAKRRTDGDVKRFVAPHCYATVPPMTLPPTSVLDPQACPSPQEGSLSSMYCCACIARISAFFFREAISTHRFLNTHPTQPIISPAFAPAAEQPLQVQSCPPSLYIFLYLEDPCYYCSVPAMWCQLPLRSSLLPFVLTVWSRSRASAYRRRYHLQMKMIGASFRAVRSRLICLPELSPGP